MTQPAINEQEIDFLLTEYREAANAYFKGVDIGWTGFRSYLTINALFAALIGALAEPRSQLAAAGEIVKLIPYFALVASFALAVVTPHYFRHLENCRRRCQEIEELRGGKLFMRLGTIGRGSKIGATAVLVILLTSIVFFWTYVAIKSIYPSFQFFGVIP